MHNSWPQQGSSKSSVFARKTDIILHTLATSSGRIKNSSYFYWRIQPNILDQLQSSEAAPRSLQDSKHLLLTPWRFDPQFSGMSSGCLMIQSDVDLRNSGVVWKPEAGSVGCVKGWSARRARRTGYVTSMAVSIKHRLSVKTSSWELLKAPLSPPSDRLK